MYGSPYEQDFVGNLKNIGERKLRKYCKTPTSPPPPVSFVTMCCMKAIQMNFPEFFVHRRKCEKHQSLYFTMKHILKKLTIYFLEPPLSNNSDYLQCT